MRFKGKTALITGGTGELGRVVTKKLVQEGAEVAVTYHSESEIAEFRKSYPEILALRGDLSKESDVIDVFSRFLSGKNGLDILCNLVGGYMPKKNIAALTEHEWDFMFSLNLKTCFLCTRSAMAIMEKRKYGRIVNVSAMAGLVPSAGRGSYGISKAAVAAFTAIAGEEAKAIVESDITVNAIAPSILLTEGNKRSASKEEVAQWVTLEEAADVILFLASGEASAINGETIKVYGDI